jgi:phytoene desaturase
MSPFQCPSLFSILSFLEYEYGVFHPIGGCGAISQKMAQLAEQMGVELHLGEPVQRVLFEGRRAVGVQTETGKWFGGAVVVNADFARAMTRLVPNELRRRYSDKKIAKKKFSCSTFMMYLGVDGRDQLPHHSIYISKDYAQNLRDIETEHVLSNDPSIYIQNATVTDSSLAPEGQSSLYLLAPVTHQTENVDWSKETAAFRERMLRQAAKIGYPDLEKRIRYERIITPQDWDTRYEIHKGATFNLSHSLGQLLHLRPKNRFDDVDGMYLVGGGTHPGSGLPVIFESARITSRLVLEDLGIKQPAARMADAHSLPVAA